MSTVLFCIPLKPNHLDQYLEFLALSRDKHQQEWQQMLARYDITDVKIWHKEIGEQQYVFVSHSVGPDFEHKIQQWNDSKHPFDKWFREQIEAVYDGSGIDTPATQLFEMEVV